MHQISNPTSHISLNFGAYLADVERTLAQRTVNGIPNYAFSLDNQLRQKIARVGIVRELARTMTALAVPEAREQYLMYGVAVGPRQYPEVHAMGEECARRLGIGIPQIFIYHDHEVNAFTIATDDAEPIVVLTSGLVESLDLAELKFVIGHECGHIHNLHSIYNLAAEMIANPVMQSLFNQVAKAGMAVQLIQTVSHLQLIASAMQGALRLFFLHWSRCAEITCDRAGLICVGDLPTAQLALAKLVVGHAHKLQGFNIDEFVAQLQRSTSPMRLMELFADHPLIPRRIEALRLYATCATLFDWRPEMRGDAPALSHEEADQRCEQLINVFAKGKAAALKR